MKKFNIYTIAGLTMLIVIASCKKIDKVSPYDSIEVSDAFKSVKDATAWDVGLYSSLRNNVFVSGQVTIGTDVQGDQLNASLDFGNRNGSEHRWGQFFLADDYLISGVWSGYYNAIANINVAIDGFTKIKPANAAETAQLNQYTGDLYLARAFYYHNLILRWAKPYEPATAASDPGVPLVIKYDLEAKPARATVKQVYDQIISDITAAEGLLANVSGTQGAQTFTIDAATALEARVRLHMQDWAGAYAAAEKLIAGGKYPLITNASAFKDYWAVDGTQESILQLYYSPSQLPANNSPIYLGFNSATDDYDPDFIPSQWVVDLYADNDIRKAAYFDSKATTIHGIDAQLTLVNKYPGNPDFFTSSISNYYNEPKVFRIAEMYLIAAESAVNLPNEGEALTALNALRRARGLANATSTGTALVQDVRDERFRELAFEGFRLDDLKRWHLGFTRRDPQNINVIQTGAAYNTLSIQANDNKFVWGLPTNDITVNKNLTQNPGW